MKTGLGILLCFSVATAAFSQTNGGSDLTPQVVARESLDAYAALTSYSDTGKTVEFEGGRTNITTFSIRMQRPNLFKIHWVQTTGNQTNQGIWWADGHPPFSPGDTWLMTNTVGRQVMDQPEGIWAPFAIDDVRKSSGQVTIVLNFFLQLDPGIDDFLTFAASKTNSDWHKIELTDGKFGGVDCYIIVITWPAKTHDYYRQQKTVARLWIGKQDHLVHQIQSSSETPDTTMTQTHENISINQKYADADFQENIPKKNSSVTVHSSPPATFSHGP